MTLNQRKVTTNEIHKNTRFTLSNKNPIKNCFSPTKLNGFEKNMTLPLKRRLKSYRKTELARDKCKDFLSGIVIPRNIQTTTHLSRNLKIEIHLDLLISNHGQE